MMMWPFQPHRTMQPKLKTERDTTMPAIEILGVLAGTLTTFSAAPQLVYSYRTRDVASIELKFLLMLASGLFLWGLYGLIVQSFSIAFFNFIGCALWLPVIVLKVKKQGQGK